MSLVFFTDRDLGKVFPGILKVAGLDVVRHADRFAPDCPDEEWLEHVGRDRLVAITHDARIRYKPNELAAVRNHGVTLLVVVGKAPFPILARNFVATLPRIEHFLEERKPPLIAKIYRATPLELLRNPDSPGSVDLWYPR